MSPPTDPLNVLLSRAGADMMPFGPPLADGAQLEVAESFGAFEAEYAAMRRHVGVMHLPQRGVIRLSGADVKDYLHNLCTQQIKAMTAGQSVRAFQLDEKGHIAADLIVHHGEACTWVELDRFDLPWMVDLLDKRLFTEDVVIDPAPYDRALLWLIGPAAVQALTAVAGPDAAERVSTMASMPGTHHVIDLPIGDDRAAHCTAYRWDLGSLLGVRLMVPTGEVAAVYGRLLEAVGHETGGEVDASFGERRRASLRGRPVGWSAFNTVRIEEGVPLYHIDFGPDSLPAEVPGPHGIDAAVSFTKGCYLGQEVVARMKSLGHPKKLLVGLKPAADVPVQVLPVAGGQVFEAGDPPKVIGAVTSSAASPLRGQAAVAFAVVRWGRHKPGTAVRVVGEGAMHPAEVTPLDALGGV